MDPCEAIRLSIICSVLFLADNFKQESQNEAQSTIKTLLFSLPLSL